MKIRDNKEINITELLQFYDIILFLIIFVYIRYIFNSPIERLTEN